jgi:hypothetical protein
MNKKFSNTDVVYDILKDDYKKKQVSWVRAAIWVGPELINIKMIDSSNKKNWQISKKKVKKYAKKMMIGIAYHPLILIDAPDNDKLQILNGHHHFMAALKNKQINVIAYVATVQSKKGPWEILKRNQENGYTLANTELYKKH